MDRADGFIHLSTAGQAPETLRRHFAGQIGLALIEIDLEALGPALKWEPSRGGDLFPHVYGPIDMAAVRGVEPIPDDAAERAAFAAALERRS